ncbi:hypothetical protein MSA03_09310 [Microbacterium saccharophilum]|uniref:hypothetical protein n=1 Tax=Microbacterium saccharophilum TaxID=1213358 RepID=UPI0011960360|nr:hypothetical protein [Microbacterium saccharophilum]GEP47423.1 hypothetical protein MSA03_09310 [Microbacterium saccharophilum]
MDGTRDLTETDAVAPAPAPADPAPAPGASAAPARTASAHRRRRRRLAADLTALGLVGVLLAAALTGTGAYLYQQLYSPTAFVLGYLDLLSQGRAADALAIPGVPVDSADLTASRLPLNASEALLRRDALAPLTDITAEEVEESDGITSVTVSYSSGPFEGTSTFQVERNGWIGVAPSWRFAQSPLAVIDLTVRGAMQFRVNGFEVDKRQVSPDGVDADPLAAIPLLVFSPGLYALSVDTPISVSKGVAVLSDTPQAQVPVDLQTQPTPDFVDVVQEKVEGFLTACAEQQVLQPTGCPFGIDVKNRIADLPTWSITQQPTVALAPDGANWVIRRTEAVAHVDVLIRRIEDGTVFPRSEDVPFFIEGTVTILPDGTASIQVSSAE